MNLKFFQKAIYMFGPLNFNLTHDAVKADEALIDGKKEFK